MDDYPTLSSDAMFDSDTLADPGTNHPIQPYGVLS